MKNAVKKTLALALLIGMAVPAQANVVSDHLYRAIDWIKGGFTASEQVMGKKVVNHPAVAATATTPLIAAWDETQTTWTETPVTGFWNRAGRISVAVAGVTGIGVLGYFVAKKVQAKRAEQAKALKKAHA